MEINPINAITDVSGSAKPESYGKSAHPYYYVTNGLNLDFYCKGCKRRVIVRPGPSGISPIEGFYVDQECLRQYLVCPDPDCKAVLSLKHDFKKTWFSKCRYEIEAEYILGEPETFPEARAENLVGIEREESKRVCYSQIIRTYDL